MTLGTRTAKLILSERDRVNSSGGTFRLSDMAAIIDAEFAKEAVSSPAKAPRTKDNGPRGRDAAFEALVSIQGANLATLNQVERGKINKALMLIRESTPDVSEAEIRLRAREYGKKYRSASLTAPALASHWSELGSARSGFASGESPAPAGWREWIRQNLPVALPEYAGMTADERDKAQKRASEIRTLEYCVANHVWRDVPQVWRAKCVEGLKK